MYNELFGGTPHSVGKFLCFLVFSIYTCRARLAMCECGENQTQQNRKAKERRKKEFLFCGRQNFCVFCFIVPEMASKLSQITKIRRSKCSRNCDKVKRGKKCIGERKNIQNEKFSLRNSFRSCLDVHEKSLKSYSKFL